MLYKNKKWKLFFVVNVFLKLLILKNKKLFLETPTKQTQGLKDGQMVVFETHAISLLLVLENYFVPWWTKAPFWSHRLFIVVPLNILLYLIVPTTWRSWKHEKDPSADAWMGERLIHIH